jgi:alpha-tubulin suppressor-like RCC1 family protein
MFKNGTRVPAIGPSFPKGELRAFGLGCGYLSVIDEQGRVYSWGDNYAVSYLLLIDIGTTRYRRRHSYGGADIGIDA